MGKKILSFVLVIAAVLSFSFNAFAASGLSDGEKSLLAYADKKAVQYDVYDTKLYKAYYDEVSRYLTANKENLSDETVALCFEWADKETAKIEKVLDEYGTTSLTVLHFEHPQVWEDLWNEVRNDMTPELLKIGIIVSADVKAHLFTLSDKEGNVISSGGNTIQWTGASAASTVAATVVLVAVVCACVIVARRKGLFNR